MTVFKQIYTMALKVVLIQKPLQYILVIAYTFGTQKCICAAISHAYFALSMSNKVIANANKFTFTPQSLLDVDLHLNSRAYIKTFNKSGLERIARKVIGALDEGNK